MIFHENRLPADDSHEISCLICYFWKKAAKFEIVVCSKLKVALYGLVIYLLLISCNYVKCIIQGRGRRLVLLHLQI